MTIDLMVTAAMTALLVGITTFVHYEVLRLCNEKLPGLRFVAGRAKVLLAMGAAFCSHLTHIAIFAAAYAFLHSIALGSLHGTQHGTVLTFLYFSTETYTSLGFGDVYPVGELRLVAGIEALTGLLMISWTASFTYLEMGRHWLARER